MVRELTSYIEKGQEPNPALNQPIQCSRLLKRLF